ncbi:MAG: hypothetical protein VKL98_09430 [Cyanobacteriota bacterium]|nr:hypothetical protein [Cyanobacteriota bacterium]
MKPSPSLLAISSLVAVLSPVTVQAEEFALSFDLPTVPDPLAEPTRPSPALAQQQDQDRLPLEAILPLPVPALGANPPMRYHSPQQLPKGVYRRAVAVALTEEITAEALLPPSPPASIPKSPMAVASSPDPRHSHSPSTFTPKTIALSFDLAPLRLPPLVPTPEALELAENPWSNWFVGNSDSLVARAIGNAEGTRTATGGLTRAYYGHRDPGNQAWNLGTFSYQHGAGSPGEADQKQLQRLQSQIQVLQKRALKHGLTLSLEETLNGLDLANQSPLAAIGRVGYVERLAEAKANGHAGMDAIVVARTRSYINPETQRWNAPGLGNTETSIRRDQERRTRAVAQALAAYQRDHPDVDGQVAVLGPAAVAIAPPSSPTTPRSAQEVYDDNILSFDLELASSSDPTLATALQPVTAIVDRGAEEETPTVSPGESQQQPTKPSVPPIWSQVREAHQSTLAYQLDPLVKPEVAEHSQTADSSLAAKPPHPPADDLNQAIGALPETIVHFPASPSPAQVAPSPGQAVGQLDQEMGAVNESAAILVKTVTPGKTVTPADTLGLRSPLASLNLP